MILIESSCVKASDRDATDAENFAWQRKKGEPSGPPFCSIQLSRISSAVLDLDFDVDTGRQFYALQAVDRFAIGVHDVDQALVNAHLEVLS